MVGRGIDSDYAPISIDRNGPLIAGTKGGGRPKAILPSKSHLAAWAITRRLACPYAYRVVNPTSKLGVEIWADDYKLTNGELNAMHKLCVDRLDDTISEWTFMHRLASGSHGPARFWMRFEDQVALYKRGGRRMAPRWQPRILVAPTRPNAKGNMALAQFLVACPAPYGSTLAPLQVALLSGDPQWWKSADPGHERVTWYQTAMKFVNGLGGVASAALGVATGGASTLVGDLGSFVGPAISSTASEWVDEVKAAF